MWGWYGVEARPASLHAPTADGLTKGLREREQAKLGQITEAMKRLDAGTYGHRVVCGDPIAFERLRVFPEAPICARCAGR